jgi:hypothetical protein
MKTFLSNYSKKTHFKCIQITSKTFKNFTTLVNTQNTDYKYIIVNKAPIYWNELFIKNHFNEIGDIEYIKKINQDLNNNTNNYSLKPSNDNAMITKNTLSFVIKLQNFNENKASVRLSKIIEDHSEIQFNFTKNININKINVSKPKQASNMVLIYSKNSNKKIWEYKEINDYLLDVANKNSKNTTNDSKIHITKSHYGNYAYIWFENLQEKDNFTQNVLSKCENDIYTCSSNIYLNEEKLQKNKSGEDKITNNNISFNSKQENDIVLLKSLTAKLEVLNCTYNHDSEKRRAEFHQKIESLRTVMKDKEKIPYIKPHGFIGRSGMYMYNC